MGRVLGAGVTLALFGEVRVAGEISHFLRNDRWAVVLLGGADEDFAGSRSWVSCKDGCPAVVVVVRVAHEGHEDTD